MLLFLRAIVIGGVFVCVFVDEKGLANALKEHIKSGANSRKYAN